MPNLLRSNFFQSSILVFGIFVSHAQKQILEKPALQAALLAKIGFPIITPPQTSKIMGTGMSSENANPFPPHSFPFPSTFLFPFHGNPMGPTGSQ